MNIVPEIAALDTEMRGWRHRLHAHPETAFEETVTSAFVADTLRSFGLDVHTGLAGTGVVGALRNGRASAALVCAPISTRCTFMRRRECRMRRR
jgi:metal-dependent amidase/aminoacylase/carboxypeptidase family protein